jgi:hypothetical protein
MSGFFPKATILKSEFFNVGGFVNQLIEKKALIPSVGYT